MRPGLVIDGRVVMAPAAYDTRNPFRFTPVKLIEGCMVLVDDIAHPNIVAWNEKEGWADKLCFDGDDRPERDAKTGEFKHDRLTGRVQALPLPE